MSGLRRLTERLRGMLRLLDGMATWLPQLALRGLLAHDFWVSGLEKLHGANWFTAIQADFPPPFSLLPAALNWHLATAVELIGAVALLLGLGTRLLGLCLCVLVGVAIISVHAGHGYNVCAHGWKLPLIYLVILLPLILGGPGKLSLDHWLRQRHLHSERRLWT